MAAPVWQSSTTLAEGSAANAIVTYPASLAAGDVVVVMLYKESTSAVTLPDGTWTQENSVATSTNVHQQVIFWKRCAGGESGTVTFSWTGATFRTATMHRVTGCIASGDPWWPTQSTNVDNVGTGILTLPATSLTGTPIDTLLWNSATDFAGSTTVWTPSTGFTLRASNSAIGVFTKDNTAGGNTGTVQGSVDAGADTKTAFLGALLPPSASSIPPSAPRTFTTRDPGEAWWIQRDRSNANLVATAANPLPMPLAVAFGEDPQRTAARWPLPFAAGAVYGQRDRRNALLVASGPVAADPLTLPDGATRQRLPAAFVDRREVPTQRAYVSDPSLLDDALLENELLGDAVTGLRARTPATHTDRRETVPQRSYVDPGLTQPSLLENELLGGATTALRVNLPATHADRREVVPPRLVLADQSTAPPALFDPTLAGPRTAQLVPATHTDRRKVPQQRTALAAPDDVVIVGTGATGAWWSEDAAVAYMAATLPHPTVPQSAAGAPFDPTLAGLPAWIESAASWRTPEAGQQRPALADQSTAAVTAFDPTQAGILDWLLNEAATHWRTSLPAQRPVFADPTLQPQSDPTLFAVGPGRAAVTWPTDRREVPQQRPYVSDPSTYPTVASVDPLTIAYGVGGTYWLLYNTAALTVDRRQVPQQRPYRSDPPLLASALLENELLGGAGTLLRSLVPATHTDRREVPWQPPRVADASSGPVFDVTLAPFPPARLTPATHGDRREVPAQRPVFAAIIPPVPADPTLLGYLVARIARTWATPDARTWRPQQRAVLYAYGATPPYVRPGRMTVVVSSTGYFTQAAAVTGTMTGTARSTATLHPDS